MTHRRRTIWALTIAGIVIVAAGVLLLTFVLPDLPPDGPFPQGRVAFYCTCALVVGGLTIFFGQIERSSTPNPIRQVEMLASPLSVYETRTMLQAWIEGSGGELDSDTTQARVRAYFGSRLVVRLIGVFTRYGVDRLPYRLEAQINEAADGAQVLLSLTSDEGWYLFRGQAIERAYKARFDYVAAVLQSALSGPPLPPA